jgi:hypothetical protein
MAKSPKPVELCRWTLRFCFTPAALHEAQIRLEKEEV